MGKQVLPGLNVKEGFAAHVFTVGRFTKEISSAFKFNFTKMEVPPPRPPQHTNESINSHQRATQPAVPQAAPLIIS
jgi:hypothetical protein